MEKTFRLVGYVLNEVSHEPIPGVMVESGYWVVGSSVFRTDARGRFVLHLPISFLNKGRRLQVHTMLYEGQAAIPTDTTQTVTLMLKRNAYRFKPFGCQQLADTVHIPPYVTMPILGYPGSQYAFLIRDTTARASRASFRQSLSGRATRHFPESLSGFVFIRATTIPPRRQVKNYCWKTLISPQVKRKVFGLTT